MTIQLGRVIRDARKAANLTRVELEQRANLPPRSLERWELRGQRPDDKALLAIAVALGLPPSSMGLATGVEQLVAVGLAEVLDGLVVAYGAEQVAMEAVRAAFRRPAPPARS